MSNQPEWLWNQEQQTYYRYDAYNDTLLFADGRRMPRPANVPRTAFASSSQIAPSPSSFALSPTPQSSGYTTGRPVPPYQTQATVPGVVLSSVPGQSRSPQGYPDSTRRSLNQVDALAQNLANVTVSTQYPTPGSSRQPLPVTPQVRFGNNGQRIVETADPNTNIRTVLQTAPPNAITDPVLLQNGIIATSRLLPSDDQVYERLFKSFRLREQPRKFFTVGKVFHVLWVEPAGESNTQITGLEVGTTIGRYGERAFSKARRFVVVREGDNYCSALPITSYGHRGVGKPGVNKSEHSIIYTSKIPPDPLPAELPVRDEEGMRPHAIRVDTDDPIDKLDNLSRLDYGKVHTIQHNIKVKAFGKVNPKSMNALINQFGNVWNTMPFSAPSASSSIKGVRDVDAPSAAPRRPSQSSRTHSAGGSSQAQSARVERQLSETDRTALLQADARAAIQRLIQRGYSEEQAQQAIREELRRRASTLQALPADEDGGEDDSSDEDDEENCLDYSVTQRQASAPVQATSRSTTSAQIQQRNTAQAMSTSGTRPSSSAAQQSATLLTGSTQPQARSLGAVSSSHAQTQAQNRAQAEALMARLLQEGKSQNEAMAIIRTRFGSTRSS